MKNNASVTQILAYHEVKLGQAQYDVITAIRDLTGMRKKASCESITDYLGWRDKNRVTGRLKELREENLIDYDGFTTSSYGRTIEAYRLIKKGQNGLL